MMLTSWRARSVLKGFVNVVDPFKESMRSGTLRAHGERLQSALYRTRELVLACTEDDNMRKLVSSWA